MNACGPTWSCASRRARRGAGSRPPARQATARTKSSVGSMSIPRASRSELWARGRRRRPAPRPAPERRSRRRASPSRPGRPGEASRVRSSSAPGGSSADASRPSVTASVNDPGSGSGSPRSTRTIVDRSPSPRARRSTGHRERHPDAEAQPRTARGRSVRHSSHHLVVGSGFAACGSSRRARPGSRPGRHEAALAAKRRGPGSPLGGGSSPEWNEGVYALHRAGMPATASRPLAAGMSRIGAVRGSIRHARNNVNRIYRV